jgi:hypothetical protein
VEGVGCATSSNRSLTSPRFARSSCVRVTKHRKSSHAALTEMLLSSLRAAGSRLTQRGVRCIQMMGGLRADCWFTRSWLADGLRGEGRWRAPKMGRREVRLRAMLKGCGEAVAHCHSAVGDVPRITLLVEAVKLWGMSGAAMELTALKSVWHHECKPPVHVAVSRSRRSLGLPKERGASCSTVQPRMQRLDIRGSAFSSKIRARHMPLHHVRGGPQVLVKAQQRGRCAEPNHTDHDLEREHRLGSIGISGTGFFYELHDHLVEISWLCCRHPRATCHVAACACTAAFDAVCHLHSRSIPCRWASSADLSIEAMFWAKVAANLRAVL